MRGFGHLPLIDSDDAALRDIGFYNDWVSHPEPDSYWEAMSPSGRVEQITAPAFLVAGWYDFLLDGQMRDFQRIRSRAPARVRAGTKLLIGPWSHSFFNHNLKNYGIGQRWLEAIPFEYIRASKDWLDYSLKGVANGWDRRPAVRAYVLGANTWRDEEDWPPRDAADRAYYLHSGGKAQTLDGDGRLALEAPVAAQPDDAFQFDPANPVPTKGGGHGNAWTAGPVDQREVERRPDVLVYTSDPVEQPLLVMGQVRARVYASSTARDTDFTAKLVDVFPDGRALIVCEGILRARYREGIDRPKLLQPGEVYPFDIELGPTAVSFQPGHRIRLEISSSNAPRYDVNPNTGGNIATEKTRVTAAQRVLHGSAHPSALILPVMSNTQGSAR
jgi:putative CocE/NonD family hydrolase